MREKEGGGSARAPVSPVIIFGGEPTHPRAAGRPLAPSTTPLPPRPESEALGVLLRDGAVVARHRKSHQTAGEALGDDLDPTLTNCAAKPKAVQTPHPRGGDLSAKVLQCPTKSDARGRRAPGLARPRFAGATS
jgi:hypothetical protein